MNAHVVTFTGRVICGVECIPSPTGTAVGAWSVAAVLTTPTVLLPTLVNV